MRLVDADALCTHIENEFDGVCVYDVSGNEAAREFCDMVDITPTIDAIPVEWMRNVLEEAKEFPRVEHETIVAIPYLIKWWQKEQEAR